MQSTSVLDRHRKVLGVIYVVFGALWAIAAIVVFGLFVFGGAVPADNRNERMVVVLFGAGIAVFLLLMAAVGFMAGFGMLRRRAWSKAPAIISAVLSLTHFPLGTAVGIYTLWFWLQPNTGQLFFPQGREPRGPELGGPDLRRPLPT
ncbi:MAG: hypothetical protein JXB05_10195 [Myxococcaceae bacterium]|nr:hypothetical protein [Myxococcaceae bacterium]